MQKEKNNRTVDLDDQLPPLAACCCSVSCCCSISRKRRFNRWKALMYFSTHLTVHLGNDRSIYEVLEPFRVFIALTSPRPC